MCGACLNICPVYRNIGGHTYNTTYPGPIGSVLTPHLRGSEFEAQCASFNFMNPLIGAVVSSENASHAIQPNGWARRRKFLSAGAHALRAVGLALRDDCVAALPIALACVDNAPASQPRLLAVARTVCRLAWAAFMGLWSLPDRSLFRDQGQWVNQPAS